MKSEYSPVIEVNYLYSRSVGEVSVTVGFKTITEMYDFMEVNGIEEKSPDQDKSSEKI